GIRDKLVTGVQTCALPISMQLQDDYFAAYRSLKLTRDASGVLVVEFHSNGGPFTFTAQDHTEFVDAFYRIAQDRANKIVILTGRSEERRVGKECWCECGR